MRGYLEKYDLANMANMSNMANTRQSLDKNSNDMAKPFANGDFDKNGEFGENVEYSESSSRHPLKSGNFGEYGENDEFDVARAPLIVVILTKMANLGKLDCKTVGFFFSQSVKQSVTRGVRALRARSARASLPSLTLCFQPRSRSFVWLPARTWIRKNTDCFAVYFAIGLAEGVPWIVDFVENGESGENKMRKLARGHLQNIMINMTRLGLLNPWDNICQIQLNQIHQKTTDYWKSSGVNYVLAPCTSQVKVNIFLLFNYFQSRLTYQK